MRVISIKRLREYWLGGHADAEQPLKAWFAVTEKASWGSFADLRASFPAADRVGEKVVFNIGGNKYRLVALVNFQSKYVLVKWVGTHAEYDRLDL